MTPFCSVLYMYKQSQNAYQNAYANTFRGKTFSCKMCCTHMTYLSRYVLYMIYTAYVYKKILVYPCSILDVEICRVHMPLHFGENPTLCKFCGIYNNYINRSGNKEDIDKYTTDSA